MGGLRTLLAALPLMAGLPVMASAQTPWSLTFAACAGRLSAQVEHQWLMRDAAASVTGAQKDQFTDLLATVVTDQNATALLALRIEAKQAQATLLRRATFNADARDARWAGARAAQGIAACVSLVPNPQDAPVVHNAGLTRPASDHAPGSEKTATTPAATAQK